MQLRMALQMMAWPGILCHGATVDVTDILVPFLCNGTTSDFFQSMGMAFSLQAQSAKTTIHQNIVNQPPSLGTITIVEPGALMDMVLCMYGRKQVFVMTRSLQAQSQAAFKFAILIALVWTVTSHYCLSLLTVTAYFCVEVTHSNDHVSWNGCKSSLSCW